MSKQLPEHYTNIEDARSWLQRAANTNEGATCPCCDRFDKVYRRRINKAAVADLISLYKVSKRHGFKVYHYSTFMPGTIRHGDFAKFRHLDMIDRPDPASTKKKTSGCYRITKQGAMFCEGKVAIPERIVLYHDELIAVEGDRRLVTDLFPNFDFTELMNA
jgi:hypothetical protein